VAGRRRRDIRRNVQKLLDSRISKGVERGVRDKIDGLVVDGRRPGAVPPAKAW
jgi:hypothetical protein